MINVAETTTHPFSDPLQWGDLFILIGSIATVALVWAAITAGRWARKAATSTAAQAAAARKQVMIAQDQLTAQKREARQLERVTDEQLKLARAEANRLREEASRSYRDSLELKLDALMPMVSARATAGAPPKPLLTYLDAEQIAANGGGVTGLDFREFENPEMQRYIDPTTPSATEAYRVALTFTFINHSAVPARIDITNAARGFLDPDPEGHFFLMPGEQRIFAWVRTTNAIEQYNFGTAEFQVDDRYMDFGFSVRDQSMLVRDDFNFRVPIRLGMKNGDRVVVFPTIFLRFKESWATRTGPRSYDHLDITPGLPE